MTFRVFFGTHREDLEPCKESGNKGPGAGEGVGKNIVDALEGQTE